MKVVKFGGTSVGSSERMRAVAEIVTANKEKVIVVLSAMSGVTNKLVALGDTNDVALLKRGLEEIKLKHFKVAIELLKDVRQCKIDIELLIDNVNLRNCFEILALGEQLSTLLFNHYLLERGLNTKLLNALDFMALNSEGEPDEQRIYDLIKPILEDTNASILITQGFICRNELGAVSNLKRGGSDYSAALIAAATNASIVEIWTDIDGFHNNDPRFVENTKSISCLSFSEAAELAYFGAKILHPATIWPARRKGISVQLKNTLAPNLLGTIINDEGSGHGFKAVAAKDGITAISIRSARMLMAYGFLSKVFGVFEKHKTPIDMITTSEVAVSMTIDDVSALPEILEELRGFGEIKVDHEQTIVSVVGKNIGVEQGLAAPVFEALKEVPLRMISFGGSEHNVSVLMPKAHKKAALNALQNQLFALRPNQN